MTKFSSLYYISCLLLLLFSFSSLRAQTEQCGTVPFNNKLGKGKENKAAFEHWMDRKLQEKQSFPFLKLAAEAVYTIPVVVHIIHQGEAVGKGSNIPFEQVLDQIETLNNDFRRLNEDTVNTPEIFRTVAADTRIEFVLARQDPEGFPTNGVVRVEGNKDNYGLNSASELSELSYWPSDFYMNIWVAPLEPGLLGYASFPVSDLPGLEEASGNPLTDGLVISYRFFGSGGNASSQSLGRTVTHEVGHFLGLRHIWGDGDCSVDDYVDDTPLQDSETNGCPEEKFSCGNLNMIQNYMDYTSDACMNLFTAEQKARMRIVLENSERRNTLITSFGLESPVLSDNDAGINRVVAPAPSECDGIIFPEVSVYNAGQNQLESFRISLYLQGNLVEEKTGTANLATGESTTLSFSSLNLSQGPGSEGNYEITYMVTQANGVDDENPTNNERSLRFIVPQTGELPLAEDFDSNSDFLEKVIIRNPDNGLTWQLTEAPGFGSNNQALFLNFYDYENAFGERDALYTPTYDFGNLKSATLVFRYAYAPYIDEDNRTLSDDGLRVGISLDCGATLDTLLFDQTGEDLATEDATTEPFFPQSRAEWRTVEIPLTAYLGQPNVQLAFIGVNDYGNNLFLDDIRIQTEPLLDVDIAITQVVDPSLISDNSNPSPLFVVKNQGKSTVQRFEVVYQVDEQNISSFVYNAFPVEPGEEKEIPLEVLNLSPGLHTLKLAVVQPNLQTDDQIEDNQLVWSFYIDDSRDVIPLIQDFDDALLPDVLSGDAAANSGWVVINPDSSLTWEVATAEGRTPNNVAARIQNFFYEDIGSSDLLVSPVLDFSNTSEASMFFKVSYGLFSQNYVDTLRVLVSRNGGISYEEVYMQSGERLAVAETDSAWIPLEPSDWKQQFVDLSAYAGESNVRIAFENINGYGNNLYLDDIEFYLSDEQEILEISENTYRLFPNPTDGLLNVKFNLSDREDAMLYIFTLRGELLWQQAFPLTLNQIYELNLLALPAGMYILKVNSPSVNTSQRFIVY